MRYLIYFLLFILPFIVLPIGISPFESPKIYGAEIGIIVLIIYFTFQSSLDSLWRKEYLPLGGLGLIGVIGVILMPTATSFYGNVFRMQGLFLFLLIMVFTAISSQIKRVSPTLRILFGLIAVQLVAAISFEGKIDYRAIGTLGEANSLAASSVFLLPFVLFFEREEKEMGRNKRWREAKRDVMIIKIICLCMSLLLILFSGSRSGFIAFSLVMLFYWIQRFSIRVAFVVSMLLFLISLTLPFLSQHQIFENRATVWQTAFVAGFQRPVLGWGLGNTEYALKESSKFLSNNLRFEYVDHTHNIFLEYWVTLGAVGLMLFVYVLSRACYTFQKRYDARSLAILLGLVIMLAFNPLSIAILLQFWYTIGQSFTDEVPS